MMKAIRGNAKKTYTVVINTSDKKDITNEMASVLENQMKAYVNEQLSANMAKYNEMLISSERSTIWKFLYAVGGSAVLIVGTGAYAFEHFDKKIDTTKQELDKKIEATKLDLKQDIKHLDTKIDRILERLSK